MTSRIAPAALEKRFAAACASGSDICEHLELLRELASKCDHVTEFGTRHADGSTVAFLAAQPETFITWDVDPYSTKAALALFKLEEKSIEPAPSANLPPPEGVTAEQWLRIRAGGWSRGFVDEGVPEGLHLRSNRIGRTCFQPRVGDTLKITIEPTDLLFIDTLHTARHLKAELERHGDPMVGLVHKYLVFHDTETFGMRSEDGTEPGLRAAIRWFQKNTFPLWGVKYDYSNCNGLVVLERVDVSGAPGIVPDQGRSRFK